mgnify:CR=1 FL=1
MASVWVGLGLAVVVGVALGLLGGGGSILTVPILTYVVGFDPQEAIAASLFIVGVTSAIGVLSHARARRVRWRVGVIFGAASMVGAFFGGFAGGRIPGSVLMILFAIMMVATAAFQRRRRKPSAPVVHPRGHLPVLWILLAGVAVSSFLSAVQTLVQQMGVDQLQRIYSWLLGGLGRGGWDDVRLVLPYAVVALTVLLACGYLLDMLALGDDKAVSLGLNPVMVRLVVISAASLATAAAVSVSGLIGFVGIVVPHIVRRLVGSNYRVILPITVLLGGAFMVLVDIVARTIVSPAELPIGVVTAFLGAPFFLLILRTTRHRST